jgi:hypothetical protein
MKLGKTVTGYNMIQAMTLKRSPVPLPAPTIADPHRAGWYCSGRRVLVNRGWIMRDDRGADLVSNTS